MEERHSFEQVRLYLDSKPLSHDSVRVSLDSVSLSLDNERLLLEGERHALSFAPTSGHGTPRTVAERRRIAASARARAERELGWDAVARRTAECYASALRHKRGDVPQTA